MKVYRDLNNFEVKNPVVTIGNFDGIHLGHKSIISRAKYLAKEIEGETVILTLWPHPRIVLNKASSDLKFLTLIDEKIEILERTGVDHLVILPFTKEFSNVSYHKFVVDYILEKIQTKKIIVGYNHHFGKNREGNFESLKKLATEYNFYAEQKNPEIVDGLSVSSSEIRNALLKGKVQLANKFLGYNYFINGGVVEGKKLGRSIGFPTANIDVRDNLKLIPREGVYVTKVHVNSNVYGGMMNIGIKPTVDHSGRQSLEVNLFDFNDDIYGQNVKIEFIKRIRDEKKFSGLQELKEQLSMDKKVAADILNSL